MVTSVNANMLAALQAREAAQANRSSDSQAGSQTGTVDATGAARDPAVVYAGAAGAPDLSAVLSVQDGLHKAASIADVGLNAGHTISGLLNLLREKTAQAQAGQGDPAALNADYQDLLATIDQLARSAAFQGAHLLDGASSEDLTFKTDASGDSTLALTPRDFTVGGSVLNLAGTDLTGSSDDLAALLGQVDAADGALSAQLAQLNGQAQQIQTHLGVVSQLANGLSGQPDLDADSARLQALQIQQVLSGESQGIANQAPQALLSLFRTS